MANGLRTRDRLTGVTTLEITDRLTRIVNTVYTGSGAGSINVPAFATGSPWWVVDEPPQDQYDIYGQFRYPRVTVSGNTLSWDFPGPGLVQPSTIQYGVY